MSPAVCLYTFSDILWKVVFEQALTKLFGLFIFMILWHVYSFSTQRCYPIQWSIKNLGSFAFLAHNFLKKSTRSTGCCKRRIYFCQFNICRLVKKLIALLDLIAHAHCVSPTWALNFGVWSPFWFSNRETIATAFSRFTGYLPYLITKNAFMTKTNRFLNKNVLWWTCVYKIV